MRFELHDHSSISNNGIDKQNFDQQILCSMAGALVNVCDTENNNNNNKTVTTTVKYIAK